MYSRRNEAGKWEAFLGDYLEAEDRGKDRVDRNMQESKERGGHSAETPKRDQICAGRRGVVM